MTSSCSVAPAGDVPAIEVETLRERLGTAQPPLLIDVREPREHAICSIPGALLMPLGTLPERCAELPKEAALVVHCHHGGRSARAVQLLRSLGYANVVNLTGGIHAWAQRIDPSMKTYG